jgi:hypothetical protein
MDTKKSMSVFFSILMISFWVLGSAIWAETLNYKVYSYVTKGEKVDQRSCHKSNYSEGILRRLNTFKFNLKEVISRRMI